MLHGHGDDGYRHGVPVRADFSSNVRCGVDLSALRQHLFARFDRVASYPEVAAESLAAQIARNEGLAPEQVIVTNGATAAIHLIAQAFHGRRSAVVTPTFSEYADAGALHGHAVRLMERVEFAMGDVGDAELVWICNPNNPTGEVFERADLLALVAAHPRVRFVVDVAYSVFCDAEPVRAADVAMHPNLIVVQSPTKQFGVPGLRLGYLAAGPATAVAIARHNAPWSVNALALEAGRFLLERGGETRMAIAAQLGEARRLRAALGGMRGVAVRPSSTHFFLMQVGRGTAAELKQELLNRHGLLVRDASNFPGLDRRHVRIAAQTPEKNRWLEEALAQWTAA